MKPTRLALLLALAVAALATAGRPPGPVSPRLQSAVDGAGPNERVAVWVFLADKGDDSASRLRTARAALTPHARERRERNRGAGRLVDSYDVPVDRRYVDEVIRAGGRVRQVSRWLNAVSVDATPSAVDAIAKLSCVRRMDVVRAGSAPPPPEPGEPPAPLSPAVPNALLLSYGASYSQNQVIGVPALHDLGYTGSGVWICMMDAGFNNLTHPALQNVDILITHDFVNGDSIVSDQVGQMGNGDHGTATLSVIAGNAPGNLIGTAFGASYVLAKTENTEWERHVEEDAWVAAAEWADSIGVDIITSSVGYSDGFTNGETSYSWSDLDGNTTIITIGADIAASRGILVVNSAGNGGYVSQPANTLIAPADGDSVLAVGAVNGSGQRASFSSVGLSADGRTKPDVMGMGEGVIIADAYDDLYSFSSGTSFSAPTVAGAAALIMEARPNATAPQIIEALRQTASQSGTPDRLMGWGIVDAGAAAAYITTGPGNTPRPALVRLFPARPNPFNPTTTIEYEVASRGPVNLSIFDVRGSRVATLVDGDMDAGHKSVVWNGRSDAGRPLASGVYVCRLVANGIRQSQKIVLLK